MIEIKLRPQRVSDAKRFYEILNNDNFLYFPVRPSSVEDEKKFLMMNPTKRKNNFEYNYTISFDNIIVGAIGIKINQHVTYIGEIGYFIDECYWNRGIASKAVLLLEKTGFFDLKLERIEIIMATDNIGSISVAEKCNYHKEGLLKNRINIFGKFYNALLYAKTKDELM